MSEIATYLRIVHPNLTDELVSKREGAIKDLSGRFIKDKLNGSLFKVADNLVQAVDAGNNFPESLFTMAESALHKSSKAFVGEGHEVEMLVCSLLAALQLMDLKRASGGASLTCQDLVAVGLWSGLSFQVPRNESRLENLRSLLLERARAHTISAGACTRRRSDVGDISLENLNRMLKNGLCRASLSSHAS